MGARDLKKYREAELKHGRVAMLAVVGIMVQENFHPLFGFANKEMDGAIFHFQEIENVFPSFWALVVFSIGIIEAQGIFKLWDAPGTVGEGQIAGIRDDVICGDYGFDPLGLKDDEEKFLEMRTKELNNGRLAMIAALVSLYKKNSSLMEYQNLNSINFPLIYQETKNIILYFNITNLTHK